MSRTDRRRRGVTLIEIMTAAAIGLVIVTAGLAVFDGLRSAIESSDRTLVAVANLQLGTSVVQRSIENAGYHFPSTQAAVLVRKNLVSGATLNNGTQTSPGLAPNNVLVISRPGPGVYSPTNTYAGAPAIIEGSDVLEVMSGTDQGGIVQVASVGALAGSQRNIGFNAAVGNLVLAMVPQRPILLFRNATAECIGEVIAQVSGPPLGPGLPTFTVEFIDENFQPNGAPPANCPSANMNVWRLANRTRYMVALFPGDDRPSLGIQRSDLTQPTVGTLAPLTPFDGQLVEGIEDMQVATTMLNQGGLCGTQMCICDDGADDGLGVDCVLNQASGGNSAAIRGIVVEFTSRGQRDRTSFQGALPVSLDRLAPGPVDNIAREQFRLSITTPNLNPNLVAVGP